MLQQYNLGRMLPESAVNICRFKTPIPFDGHYAAQPDLSPIEHVWGRTDSPTRKGDTIVKQQKAQLQTLVYLTWKFLPEKNNILLLKNLNNSNFLIVFNFLFCWNYSDI